MYIKNFRNIIINQTFFSIYFMGLQSRHFLNFENRNYMKFKEKKMKVWHLIVLIVFVFAIAISFFY